MLRRKKVDEPWIGARIKSLFSNRDKLFARQKLSGKLADKKCYLEAKAKAQRCAKQAYWRYVENVIEVGDPE